MAERRIEPLLLILCGHLLFVSALTSNDLQGQEALSLRRTVQELREIILNQEQRLSAVESRCQSLEKRNEVKSNEVKELNVKILNQNAIILDLLEKQSVCNSKIQNMTEMLESVIGHPTPENIYIKSKRAEGFANFRKERLLAATTTTASTNENAVAFYAYSTHTFTSPSNLFVLTFDNVITNVGNGYHHHSGLFIAPRTGLYVFTWSFRIQNDAYISTELVVNESAKSAVYFDANPGIGGNEAGTVVTHVNQGDDVFVRVTQNNNLGNIISDRIGRTYFGGWMIS